MIQRLIYGLIIVFWTLFVGLPAVAATDRTKTAQTVLTSWYGLALELVRHTPTYTPPVASRTFAYFGLVAYEATASGSTELQSLAGQLNELTAIPQRETDKEYNDAVLLQSAMAHAAKTLFSNTGPTGQRALAKMQEKQHAQLTTGIAAEVVLRSEAYGIAVAQHILEWSMTDGGAITENMGFPIAMQLQKGPAYWVPTNVIRQQQLPLLPTWGNNRPFAMPTSATCKLPPPPDYSEEKSSQFYKEAQEVFETRKTLTKEQRAIARFWSDDPMLSTTPPGHWISIALQIIERDNVDLERGVETLARLGIAVADGFIGCWNSKYYYNLLRPVTYIRRTMDQKWESVLNTSPFPEYPSGHSTQSGAAAVVLTHMFGENFSFEDATHRKDGLTPRKFDSFWAAAEEAGISRLYGGIHFRAAIEQGLEQGRCIGAYAAALKTKH